MPMYRVQIEKREDKLKAKAAALSELEETIEKQAETVNQHRADVARLNNVCMAKFLDIYKYDQCRGNLARLSNVYVA